MRSDRVLLSLSIIVLLWLQALLPAHAQPPLTLSFNSNHASLAGHLQWLDEPSGTLKVTDVMSDALNASWTDLPGNLSASYTSHAVWLRFQVHVKEPGQWMVHLRNALIDDVQVYMRAHAADTLGSWQLLGISGDDFPHSQWPVDVRSPALPFNPEQAGFYTIVMRLKARNALNVPVEIWPRLAFDNHSRREGLLFGLYVGFYLLLIGLHTLFWRSTRAPVSGMFVAYASLCVSAELLTLGLPQQLLNTTGAWSDRALGLCMAFAYVTATHISVHQLGLRHLWPTVTSRLLRGVWCVGWSVAVLISCGAFSTGLKLLQVIAGPTLLALCLCAVLRATLHQHVAARFFLLVFSPYYIAVLITFCRNWGWVPVTPVTELVSALVAMAHMLMLSLWIMGNYVRRRRLYEREQLRLQAEITVRQQREGELLQALDLERRVRQEQRDFVALVSHEFRTPLAIIDTSAQQLARNLHAPPEKTLLRTQNIRTAVQRMVSLVDGYLTNDRLETSQKTAQLAACHLPSLLRTLSQDFEEGRVFFTYAKEAEHFITDEAMLATALRNLLANADRHAPAQTILLVTAQRCGDKLHITVSNESKEIPAHERPYLFDRHWRGSAAQHNPGAGLGLYLVQIIAEKLGGTATLVSFGGDDPVRLRLELPL